MKEKFVPPQIPPPEILTVARLDPGQIYPKGSGHYLTAIQPEKLQQQQQQQQHQQQQQPLDPLPLPPATPHYGTKPGHFETSIIHFLTSEGVSKVSEQANE